MSVSRQLAMGGSLCSLLLAAPLLAVGCDSPSEEPPTEPVADVAADPLPEMEAPPPPAPPPACEGETFELGRDPISRPHRVAVATDGTGLLFGWTLQQATTDGTRDVAFLGLRSSGAQTTVDRQIEGSEHQISGLALAPPFLLWLEQREDSSAVRTHRFVRSRAQSFDDLRHARTDRRVIGAPSAVGVGQTQFAGWTEAAGEVHTIRVQRFDQEELGAHTELTLEGAAEAIVVTATADDVAVLWREESTLRLRRFDHDLEARSEPVVLATDASGSFDLVLDGDESAFTYVSNADGVTLAHLVRLDARGERIDGAEIDANEAPEQAHSVQLARFGTGYVVAYRTMRSASEHGIEIALFDADLGPVATHSMTSTSWQHGALAMAVDTRGGIVLGWAEQHREDLETYTALLAARLTCEAPHEQLFGGNR